jgi:hypothetical protein
MLEESASNAERRTMQSSIKPPQQAPSSAELALAYRYARWINAAARRHYVRGQCLHRSLVLYFWLQRGGLPGELRIGVRKAGGALQAHAWVTLGAHCVSDSDDPDSQFTRILKLEHDYKFV